MFFNGPYLRVFSPATTNGVNPKIGSDGRVEYNEAYLPLTARKSIETKNRRLPDHLKKRIEVVGDEPLVVRAKPGPKPKNQ